MGKDAKCVYVWVCVCWGGGAVDSSFLYFNLHLFCFSSCYFAIDIIEFWFRMKSFSTRFKLKINKQQTTAKKTSTEKLLGANTIEWVLIQVLMTDIERVRASRELLCSILLSLLAKLFVVIHFLESHQIKRICSNTLRFTLHSSISVTSSWLHI